MKLFFFVYMLMMALIHLTVATSEPGPTDCADKEP